MLEDDLFDANLNNELSKFMKKPTPPEEKYKDTWFVYDEDRAEIIQGYRKMLHEGGKYSHRSYGYKTKEELLAGEGVLTEPCKICGGVVTTKWCEPTKSDLIKHNYCFNCLFWYKIEQTLNNPRRFIIDGVSYWRGENTNDENKFRGYGGRKFKIQRNDSNEIIETTNLWCQGNVSKYFKERIKDNAKFIQ